MLIQPFGFNATGKPTGRLLSLGLYYQGGYVAYLSGNYPNQSGLIVSPVEISSSMSWPDIGGQVTPTTTAYGQGYNNTDQAYQVGYTTNGIGNCWNYSNDGYTDWFMPSLDELIFVIQNKSFIPYTLNAASYHASSAFSPNPGNQNWFVITNSAASSAGNHSDLRGVLACRYITT
jgi:hypothetical protein